MRINLIISYISLLAKQLLFYRQKVPGTPLLSETRSLGLIMSILLHYYCSVIESIICFGITVWFKGTTSGEKTQLEQIVRHASRIVGDELSSVARLYNVRLRSRARKIIADPSHPTNYLFELLPSGRRYKAIKARTHRFRNSFFPEAILAL